MLLSRSRIPKTKKVCTGWLTVCVVAHTALVYGEFSLIFSEFSLMAFCFRLPLKLSIKPCTFSPASDPLLTSRVLRHFSRNDSLRVVTRTSCMDLTSWGVKFEDTRLFLIFCFFSELLVDGLVGRFCVGVDR